MYGPVVPTRSSEYFQSKFLLSVAAADELGIGFLGSGSVSFARVLLTNQTLPSGR